MICITDHIISLLWDFFVQPRIILSFGNNCLREILQKNQFKKGILVFRKYAHLMGKHCIIGKKRSDQFYKNALLFLS